MPYLPVDMIAHWIRAFHHFFIGQIFQVGFRKLVGSVYRCFDCLAAIHLKNTHRESEWLQKHEGEVVASFFPLKFVSRYGNLSPEGLKL